MKTYTVLYAEDVPHYGVAGITANDDTAAIAAAKRQDVGTVAVDPDYENSACKRIVHIEDDTGRIIATDIALDSVFLRYGGEPERRLCDAAPDLLVALRRIAEFVLWGETIADADRKAELIEYGEYDAESDYYSPSIDSESSDLRHTVEIAREALAKLEGGAK